MMWSCEVAWKHLPSCLHDNLMANQSRSSFWRHVDQFRALIIIPASESAALKIEFKIIIIIIITTRIRPIIIIAIIWIMPCYYYYYSYFISRVSIMNWSIENNNVKVIQRRNGKIITSNWNKVVFVIIMVKKQEAFDHCLLNVEHKITCRFRG